MQIDIPFEVIDDLRKLLTVLEEVAKAHENLSDIEELIEPWLPSDAEEQINCPDLTVGLIRKVFSIRKSLRL